MPGFSQEELAMYMSAYAVVLHFRDLLSIVLAILEYYKHHFLTRKRSQNGGSYQRSIIRQLNFRRMIWDNDEDCINSIRMDRRAFYKLCTMVETIGMLSPTRNMSIEEMLATFLYILGHHVKNRVAKREFVRSGETISRQFNKVLLGILRLHEVLLKKPKHVPPIEIF